MPSIQRLALFVLFDSIENDLVEHLRSIESDDLVLTADEIAKAKSALANRSGANEISDDSFDLVHGLHMGQKIEILNRLSLKLPTQVASYIKRISKKVLNSISVRNGVMHGRPLSVDEYAIGFAFAQELLKNRQFWPILSKSYSQYNQNPESLASRAISFLDEPVLFGVSHNLPFPDYEDTGFLRREALEVELRKRILGRYPVITVQGDGGNGKTALTLHTLWNLVESNDHDFELILWYSAKTSSLTTKGVEEINSSFTDSYNIIEDAASYGSYDGSPFDNLRSLLTENKILLVIDNLETVTGPYIERLVEDFPGESKLVLTSRVPVSGDLPLKVPEFTDKESSKYLRILSVSHGLQDLRSAADDRIFKYCTRLGNKPLLIKWFALGVKSGANPERIIADPSDALRFCLENVLSRLPVVSIQTAEALVAVSDSLSSSVLSEMTTLDPRDIEDGLSNLSRFSLIEFSDLPNAERVYRLRPFVRSYFLRIFNPDKQKIQELFLAYQRIHTRFQQSRAAESFNKYEAKNYVVRTPGEAVAESKIRQLARKLLEGDYDGVEAGIATLKISDPGYFEVYRFEGFAAFSWSDLPRAIEAYEAALHYGEHQSQVHFFYGGMLLRAGYVDLACSQFASALTIDSDAAPVLREAARAEMRRSNFDVAENYLSRADIDSGKSLKEMTLIIDLWIQFFQRKTDFLVNNDALIEADIECGRFIEYLQNSDIRLFDYKIVDHLLKIESSIKTLCRDMRLDAKMAPELRDWIIENILRGNGFELDDGRFVGTLKKNGRRDTFGFMVTADGREFFVPATNPGTKIWSALNEDQPAEFAVRTKPDGRTEAYDFRLLERT